MIPFLEAVEIILGQAAVRPPVLMPQKEKRERGELIIPKMVASPTTAYWYLTEQRMIDWKIVMDCFRKKLIKETDDSDFKKTVYGSDRQFAFRLVTEKILFFIYTRQRLTYFLTLPY